MKTLEQDNLKELINSDKVVVAQYGAGWCGACRLLKPKLSSLAEEMSAHEFYYVDAEEYPSSRDLVELENLPTVAIFKNGELKKQVVGTNIDKIKESINEVASH